MKNKKGFAIIEILLVVAIIGILAAVVVPNVLKSTKSVNNISDEKNGTNIDLFLTNIRVLYKVAESQWMASSLTSYNDKTIYAKCLNDYCGKSIDDGSIDSSLEYYIELNNIGKITKFYVKNNSYQFKYNGIDLDFQNINDAEIISSLNDSEKINITNEGVMLGGSFVK